MYCMKRDKANLCSNAKSVAELATVSLLLPSLESLACCHLRRWTRQSNMRPHAESITQKWKNRRTHYTLM